MTNSPHYINFRKDKILLENKLKDSMIVDGLIDFYNQYHMGVTAENVAKKFSISRNDQDLFAYKSQIKTKEAINKGKFNDEIVSIKLKNGMTFNKDEHPRMDVDIEKLSKLKPAFKENGTVTAGNSSGINDGAASVVLMSYEKQKRNLIHWQK